MLFKKPLIIGIFLLPAFISAQVCSNWSTYFGGEANEEIDAICSDNNGNVYVTGKTNSASFPVLPGSAGDTLKGDYDAFVAMFDSCGTLAWSTFLGTADFDQGYNITTAPNGGAYVCGTTFGNNFPVSTGAYQQLNNGIYDAFLTYINANGVIVWSTYFGGTGADFAYNIATDVYGNIYFGGATSSNNLPVSAQSLQQTHGGAMDAYIASFTSSGTFRWCTYYGGSGSEDVHAMTGDYAGNIYTSGGTFSQNIAMSGSAFQQFNNGGMEIYIIKTDTAGNALWSTYFGGAGLDDCYGIITDTSSNLLMTGLTYSQTFPVTAGCFQDTLVQYSDMFVSKFSSSGNLLWSTFLGGSDLDEGVSVSVNPNGEVTVLGNTMSSDMPVSGVPVQTTLAGDMDFYLARFDSAGSLMYATFFGGTFQDEPTDLVQADKNYCYVAGSSFSGDYPVVPGSYQVTKDSVQSGVISKLFLPSDITTKTPATFTDHAVRIFPNPAQNKITIECDEEILAALIKDLNGKTISSLACSSESCNAEISDLPEAIYFVQINTSTRSYYLKLVKQ